MATLLSELLPVVRNRLIEPKAKFWSDDELYEIMGSGIRDLWRDIVDLKQEHYLRSDTTNVSLPASTNQLKGVPLDIHKVYMIEPRDLTDNGENHGLIFTPEEYTSALFQRARSISAIDPVDDVIYYAIHEQGAPVDAPTIRTAPQVNSEVLLSFSYVPTLQPLSADSAVPIPGEANNAVVAWTVAFARAKEREDRAPDAAWLAVYATEKQHLLQSLGLRQYQAPSFAEAVYQELWG